MKARAESLTFLTQNETKALLDRAKQRGARDYAMIFLAYRHGLRASEICNITMQNLDLAAGNIRCVRGKSSISNWQQLNKDEVKAVTAWLKQRPKSDSPFLFRACPI